MIKAVDFSTAFFMSGFVDRVQMLLLVGFSKTQDGNNV